MGARFRQRPRFGVLGFALALSAPLQAADAAPPRTPSTEIPTDCGTRADFDAAVRKRMGEDAPLDDVQLSITPQGERFHLRVVIGSEVRELEDPSCPELLRAAVVVALAVLMHEDEPAPAPPAPAPPAPARRDYPQLALAAGAGVVAGSVPKPTLTLELESKALFRHFGVGFDLRYLAPAEERDPRDKGVDIYGLGAGLFGIFRPAPRWEARLGLAAQRFNGQGIGSIAETQDDASWALGPTLGLSLVAIDAQPFWLGLGAEGQLNALRARFQIRNYSREISDQAQDVFVSPWIAASGFVRLGLAF